MTTPNLSVVDESRIKTIFGQLEEMEVLLDADPLQYGPKRMNGKVAKTRTLLSRCERIFLQVSQDLAFYKKHHRAAQLDFDLQKQDLFANDPEVRAGRNVADREAQATMKLRTERESLIKMEVAIQDLEMVMAVVKAKRADLRDIQGRLRDQKNLCDAEISLGRHWGSKLPPELEGPDLERAPRTDKNALEQVQELLIDSDEGGEIHLKAGADEWIEDEVAEPTEPTEPVVSEQEVDDILNLVAAVENDTEDPEPPKAPEPPVEVAPVQEAPPAAEELDMDALFSDDADETPQAKEPMSAVTTDENVDDLFNRLTVDPVPSAKKGGDSTELVGDDLDNLIDMLSTSP